MRGITIYKTVVDIGDHLLLLVSDRFFDYFNVETKY
jgi:hypothetical protein